MEEEQTKKMSFEDIRELFVGNYLVERKSEYWLPPLVTMISYVTKGSHRFYDYIVIQNNLGAKWRFSWTEAERMAEHVYNTDYRFSLDTYWVMRPSEVRKRLGENRMPYCCRII